MHPGYDRFVIVVFVHGPHGVSDKNGMILPNRLNVDHSLALVKWL
jgi:hypothetical protein